MTITATYLNNTSYSCTRWN